MAREWIEKMRGKLAESTADKNLFILSRLFPDIGAFPISMVTTPILRVPIVRLEEAGTLELARRACMYASKVFKYAIQTGRAETNPAEALRGTIKTAPVKARAAFATDELGPFLDNLDLYDGQAPTRLGLRLLLLTFVRPGELRAAAWDEFDLETAEWRVPAERMKMRAPHWVPLSRQALETLKALRTVTGHSRWLFPNERRPETFASENTFLYALYRMGYHSRATAHGFRACASTLLNELEYNPDVIERQLAHAEKNRVRAAYHRTEYQSERWTMMQDWADMLDLLKAGATVADLKALISARLPLRDALIAQQRSELRRWIATSTGKVKRISNRSFR